MNTEVTKFIASTLLGHASLFRNMSVVPLFNSRDLGPDYLTLAEALEQDQLSTELSQNGAGPRLQIINWAQLPILVVEGERLNGETHSVFNRSLLLQAESSTEIQLPPSKQNGWRCTQAALKDYLRDCKPLLGQKGLLVSINGKIAGLEMVSKEQAYRALHYHLLKKYAREASAKPYAEVTGDFCDKATTFFNSIADCEQKSEAPIAYGPALVFEGPNVSGKAVLAGRQVIHLSFTTMPGFEA